MYQFSVLDKRGYYLLDDLAKLVSLDEAIDKNCVFIVSTNGHLQGAVGFSFSKTIPRLEHIIVDIPHQKTRLGVLLLKAMEKHLSGLGHKKYYSYILNGNERMISYARKWKMRLEKTGQKGSWFYKTIEG